MSQLIAFEGVFQISKLQYKEQYPKLFFKSSSASGILVVENLMDDIKPVVMKAYEFED